MDNKEKIINLINELNNASYQYYNTDNPIMTDREFDDKLEELKKLEQETGMVYANSPTINVGAPVLDEMRKIKIEDKPMLSLDKVHSAEEIISFLQKEDVVASIKCDGLSVRLIYKDGELISANTRGTGYEGEDVTDHVKHFLNVPLKINKDDIYIIDGEAIIFENDFKVINRNKQFKNRRNTASGALSLLDMSIVKNRRLSFIAWDVIKGGDDKNKTYYSNLIEAEGLGFDTVPMNFFGYTSEIEIKEIETCNESLLELAKNAGIPCDGVVWRLNSLEKGEERGKTDKFFLNAIAWKPKDEEYVTELLSVEWSMGRTGKLTPIAIFEPIEIDGTIVERCSLHNLSILSKFEQQGLKIGRKITIYKANMIIPQLKRVIIESEPGIWTTCDVGVGHPMNCPICRQRLTERQMNDSLELYCENPKCEGKIINIIEHFLGKKGIDAKGISKATIEKLIDKGWVNSITDIFELKRHKKEWMQMPGFGEKSVTKILNSIEESRNCELSKVLCGIGIPLIGAAAAKELANKFKTYENFRSAIKDNYDFSSIDGFGQEMNNSIINFDYSELDAIVEKYLNIDMKEENDTIENENKFINEKVFVITGKLITFKNRNELKEKIEAAGGKVASTVSKKTNYLINNDINSMTAKNKTAKELNIPIITENDILEMLK